MDLITELRTIAVMLQAADIDYALCGGLAMAAHGFVRAPKTSRYSFDSRICSLLNQSLPSVATLYSAARFH